MAKCRCGEELEYLGDGKWECCVCEQLYDEFEDDDIDFYGEGIGAYDAALIWCSHGRDEDYMFGYTEEQLEDALG